MKEDEKKKEIEIMKDFFQKKIEDSKANTENTAVSAEKQRTWE